MKKMYLAIFLIILVVVVFAGCISFSNPIELTTMASSDDVNQSQGNEQSQLPQGNGDVNAGETSASVPDVTAPSQSAGENATSEGETVLTNVQVPASNEYDILRSGSFYMKGSLIDQTGVAAPMEIAITPSSVYMLSDFSGATMGLLISNDVLYMIYEDKQAYLELSDSIMNMAGLNMDEFDVTDTLDFSSYGSLSDANKVTEESYNGRTCQVYHFSRPDSGETRIYMDNSKLVRIATYTSSGKFASSNEVEYITGAVPADKSAPPANYKHHKGITGMFSFMTLLEGVIE